MCKYCKHLQELRKEDQRTIERWKRYCYREEMVLEACRDFLLYCCFEKFDQRAELISRISNLLKEDMIDERNYR